MDVDEEIDVKMEMVEKNQSARGGNGQKKIVFPIFCQFKLFKFFFHESLLESSKICQPFPVPMQLFFPATTASQSQFIKCFMIVAI